MEPWFAWSWLIGIKPIHPNGWVAIGMYWLVAIPLMFGGLGAFDLGPLVQAMAAIAFVAASLAMFGIVYSRLKQRDA